MFWGLVLEPSKRYTQKVQQAFHVSQAALELSNSTLEPVQLILDYDGACYILATLSRKIGIFQVPLDLNFNSGDQISFRTIGKGKVHLSGYHILEEDLEDIALNHDESEIEVGPITDDSENSISGRQKKRNKNTASKNVKNKKRKLSERNETASDDDSDEGEEEEEEEEDDDDDDDDDEDDITFNEDISCSDEDMEEEEEEEDDVDEDQEGEDNEEMESDVDQEVFTVPEDDSDEEEEENEKAERKTPTSSKDNKSDVSINGKTPKNKRLNDSMKGGPNKSAKKNASPAGKEAKEKKTPKREKKSPKGEKNKQESSPQKKVLEGGVIIEDMKLGDGPVAKPGKMVQVYYVGRLQSNKKQFDQTVQGPGFKFRLGKGEVIKGWDIGVNGMKVGGKRRITIPSQLAYGPKGAPPAIPPNSVLLFEVELKGVN